MIQARARIIWQFLVTPNIIVSSRLKDIVWLKLQKRTQKNQPHFVRSFLYFNVALLVGSGRVSCACKLVRLAGSATTIVARILI